MGGKQRVAVPGGLAVEEVYRKMRALASGGAGVGAAESTDPSPGPRLRQLAEGIWVIALRTPTLPPATTTNCYLVGDRELVVIDPATPDPSEKAALDEALGELEAAGRRPVAIWLTHHHGDHIADAARLAATRKIPIAAHPETAVRLPGIPVTIKLNDGDRLRLAGAGEITLRAVFTPGHAPGHLCFVEESSRLCIAGDMVAGVGSILIDPAEGDMSVYLASLHRLAGLDLAGLLPAHGPILPDAKAALIGYVAHRLWREARVLDALTESERRIADLLTTVYADVAPMLYPLAERSLLAHLIKLERDELATRTDESGQSWKMARS